MHRALALVIIALAAASAVVAFQDSGVRTVQLLPLPAKVAHGDASAAPALLDPCAFVFSYGQPGDLPAAVALYRPVIFAGANCTVHHHHHQRSASVTSVATLTGLVIHVTGNPVRPLPALDTDESYSLAVPASGTATLTAATYVGVLRGLETFSQLVLYAPVAGAAPGQAPQFHVPSVPWSISDAPAFPHRGVLVDPARGFLPVPVLERIIDGLMYSKMNVLHLHLTDSQSFTLETPRRAEVYQAGAFSAAEYYTVDDIRSLVDYAAARGVRLIPETDTPGHARAWGLSSTYASAIVCSDANGKTWPTLCLEPPCGQLNPADPGLYDLLGGVFADIVDMFPDETIHLGFDEINFPCWANNSQIQAYMAAHGLTVPTLLLEFFTKEQALVAQLDPKRRITYWEEAALQNPPMPVREQDIIQVWSDEAALQQVLNTTKASIVVSWAENVYLDCGMGNMFGHNSWCDPYKTWLQTYAADPLAGFPDAAKGRALGGEAAVWGEIVGGANVEYRMWPRTAAYGARLWNYAELMSNSTASVAVGSHANRLVARGLNADVSAERYCLLFPDMCYADLA